MNLLERMRRASPSVKSRYAFLGALSITLVIGVIWGTTVPARISGLGGVQLSNKSDDSEKGGGFLELFKQATEQFANVSDAVSDESNQENIPETRTEDGFDNVIDLRTVSPHATATPATETQSEPVTTTPAVETIKPTEEEAESVSEPIVQPLTPPSPQVILIGTTTSQNRE